MADYVSSCSFIFCIEASISLVRVMSAYVCAGIFQLKSSTAGGEAKVFGKLTERNAALEEENKRLKVRKKSSR